MDAVEVTVHFDANGKATPLRFTWKGSVYEVESAGRRWQAEDGQHILVMTPGGRIFELLYALNENRWYLRRTSPSHLVA